MHEGQGKSHAAVIVYSTYLSGGSDEQGHTIAVHSAGNTYVMGVTGSVNFPLANSLQGIPGDAAADVFVAELGGL